MGGGWRDIVYLMIELRRVGCRAVSESCNSGERGFVHAWARESEVCDDGRGRLRNLPKSGIKRGADEEWGRETGPGNAAGNAAGEAFRSSQTRLPTSLHSSLVTPHSSASSLKFHKSPFHTLTRPYSLPKRKLLRSTTTREQR